MTPQQIALVRSSFAQLAPIADSAASLFYAHLFHRDPSLRALFRGDMAHQAYRLRRRRALVIGGVAAVGGCQHDDPLVLIRAQEVTNAGEAGDAGLLKAHAKADSAHVQCGDQPAR